MVPMMYLKPGDEGFDPKCSKLVEHNGDDPRRIAKLTVKRPNSKQSPGADPNNYVVHNGVNGKGAVSPIWKDNANFFEYLVHAPGAKVGVRVRGRFTIKS